MRCGSIVRTKPVNSARFVGALHGPPVAGGQDHRVLGVLVASDLDTRVQLGIDHYLELEDEVAIIAAGGKEGVRAAFRRCADDR